MRLSEIDNMESSDLKGIRLSDVIESTDNKSPVTPKFNEPGTKTNILDFWTGGKEQIPVENYVARGIYDTGKDLSAIPAHFINQIGMNYPKVLTEKAGFEYPATTSSMRGVTSDQLANKPLEWARDVAGSIPAFGAGIIGGLKNPLIRGIMAGGRIASEAPLIGKAFSKTPELIKQAATGGIMSASYATKDNENKLQNFAMGSAVPVVGGALSNQLSRIAASNPTGRMTQMQKSLVSLHNAYEDGIKYRNQDGAKIEVSNPIKTLVDRKLIPTVENGRAVTTHITEALNNEIDGLDQAYRSVIDPNKNISLEQFKEAVKGSIKSSKELKTSGAIGMTLNKAETIFDDFKNSYGENIPLNAIDDIRRTMNKRFDPELKDAYRAIGDASRKIIYEAVPNAQPTLYKEGELLAARNFADVMNNKVIKGGRLGNYFNQVLGAAIGSSTGVPVVGPLIGALGGNMVSRRLQQSYFNSPISGAAQTLKELERKARVQLLKEIGYPKYGMGVTDNPSINKMSVDTGISEYAWKEIVEQAKNKRLEKILSK